MRYSGIVMPIFSLPTEYGIGTIGREARDFVDFLVSSGVSIWEIGSINHTDTAGSPHEAISAFAGNPLLIDLAALCSKGLLSKKQLEKTDWGKDRSKISYAKVLSAKLSALFEAYTEGFSRTLEEFEAFCTENKWWLDDYAVFAAIKEHFGWLPFQQWHDHDLEIHSHKTVDSFRETLAGRVEFFKYLQYLFYSQWGELRAYAKARGIKILGTATFKLAEDSAEKWANPAIDTIENSGEEQCHKWWSTRLAWFERVYDITKIFTVAQGEDIFFFHPLSFGGDKTQTFKFICAMGNPTAENFAEISRYTHTFHHAFLGANRKRHMPHFYEKDSIAYVSTCSDDTVRGWVKTLPKEAQAAFGEYISSNLPRDQAWCTLHTVWQSAAGIVLAPIQDFLELSSVARLYGCENPANNWTWRLRKGSLNNRLAQRISKMNKLFDRV